MNALAIFARIVERSRPPKTPHSEDIERLHLMVQVREDGEIVVSSDGREYLVQPGPGGAIRIGDDVYQGSEAEVVRGALCEILALERLPAPRWLQRDVLDRIAEKGSHTSSDIECLHPVVDLDRDDPETVWVGEYAVRPGPDGAVHVGDDRVYQGSGAKAIRGVLREILTRKGLRPPRWLQLPPTRMSLPGAIALLFGLLALAVCWLPLVGVLALPLGFLAIIIAAVAIHRIRARNTGGLSLAMTGLLTGAVGLVVALYLFFVFLVGFRGPAWQGDWNDVRGLFRTEPR